MRLVTLRLRPTGIGSGEEVIRGGGGGRAGWGLPEGKFVFVCFSRAEKIDRGIATAWMNILKRTPVNRLAVPQHTLSYARPRHISD